MYCFLGLNNNIVSFTLLFKYAFQLNTCITFYLDEFIYINKLNIGSTT